ncbi:efflux RND transporter periplasmic adaptor subunit [Jatrophihabitans endophyticus]|uniref:efflux RND transporter periplasmic adaptor subunit n=1 Tax=Jatrophihabitans endophyticus TaxID=1206085 RepID=UPI001A0EA90E|nr:biotin/lipoyl-binding protein [Jatrophihabitans endophyticus]MBE7188363.1 HlyD family efflux transporter periplasmic adaptor subunit [Jatrophihabitans endophyticus]
MTVRPWLTAVVVVVVAGAITGSVLLTGGGGSSAATASGSTRLVDVSTGTVSESVSTTGDFVPVQDKEVSFSSSATITSVRVSQGQRVRKGRILGTIDNLSLKSTLASDRSTLASAKASLSDARSSDDTTSAQLAADRSQVRTARAAVASAKTSLSDAVLRSPITGVVAAVNVTKGDQAGGSSSDSSTSNPTTTTSGTSTSSSSSSSSGDFEIIGTSQWKVSVDVDDTEIGMIAKGQQAQLTTDDHTGTIFGTVTSVSVLSSSSSGSASYPVVVTVTGSPSGLHDGAEATVEIIYKQAANAVTVPTLAVHRDGSSSYVYLSSGGRKVKKTVTTGLTDGTTTQVTSGLKSGEQVYEDVVTPFGGTGSRSSGSTGSGTTGEFPGGGSGNFPGGGSGGFPGGGTGFGGGS